MTERGLNLVRSPAHPRAHTNQVYESLTWKVVDEEPSFRSRTSKPA